MHERVDVGLLASEIETLLNFGVCKTSHISSVENVLTNRAREEVWLLLHDSELLLMVPLVVNILDIAVIVKHSSLLRVVESLNQLHDR